LPALGAWAINVNEMKEPLVVRRMCLLGVLFCLCVSPAVAQTAADKPSVTIIHSGVERLYEDLRLMFEALAGEKSQYATLQDTLDVYFIGADAKKPGLVQIYVRGGKFKSVLFAPTTNAKSFRDNLRALGAKNRILGAGLYQLTGLFNGFLKEGNGLSIIAEDRKDVTATPPNIAQIGTKWGIPGHDFIAVIENDDQIADRKTAVQQLRTELMAGIKPLAMESAEEFALRKLTLEQQISELEQVYSEAQLIVTTGSVLNKEQQLVSETKVVPLPKTSLADHIAANGKEPSKFAAVPFAKDIPLSVRIDFTLDAMRKKHAAEFLKHSRPLALKRIRENSDKSEKTRAYTEKTVEIVFDVLEKSTADGRYDSLLDVRAQASGLHTLIGAVKVDGAVVVAGLEKIKSESAVEMNKEKVGEISLHQVTLPGDLVEMQKVFGKDPHLWVGTAADTVWYAVGENALDELKKAINSVTSAAAAQPAPEPQIVQLHVKAGLWMDLFDAIRDKKDKGKNDARELAVEAFSKGGDTFDFSMRKTSEGLVLTLQLHEGILRYAGKAGAKIVKENLQ